MILATLANMRKHYTPEASIVAYSPETGEACSANPDDYCMLSSGAYLTDAADHAMVLARRIPEHFKLLEAAS